MRTVLVGAAVVMVAACGSAGGDGTGTIATVASSTSAANSSGSRPQLDAPVSDSSVSASSLPTTTVLPPTSAGEWIVRDVGPSGREGVIALVEHQGDLWLARSTVADGLVVSTVGAEPDVATPLGFSQQIVALAMASTPTGLVVAVTGVDDFVANVWVSADGNTWTAGTITDEPFDVAGIVWVDGRFVATGSTRVGAEPGMGPFRPAIFRSVDGIDWTEATPDAAPFGAEGSLSAPVVLDDRILVAGGFSSGGVVFESADGAATWTSTDHAGLAPSWLAVAGDALVGSGAHDPDTGMPEMVVLRSGRWEPVDLDAVTGPTWFRDGWLIPGGAPVFSVSFERPLEYCYENPDDCDGGYPLLVSVDEDGVASAIDPGVPDADADTAVIGADGTFHLLLATLDGLELRSWPPSRGPLPTLPPADVSEPSGPPLAEWDDTLDVGATYRYPLYTHCGIDVLGRFNGQNWWLADTVDDTFNIDGGYLFGEIEVVAADRIEYSLDGRTVAIYEPRPTEFPGCD